ncbi:hypothetical protein [Brevundimonas balnearis]|uniref:Uncharacterized protein n=1 Tax=Brevundimonas balnearis TaxID=1572858 RepID=A0ABV6R0T7_9CAUL
MQALIDLIAGLVALLAASALAQFGVDLRRPADDQPEVRRVADCGERRTPPAAVAVSRPRC